MLFECESRISGDCCQRKNKNLIDYALFLLFVFDLKPLASIDGNSTFFLYIFLSGTVDL